MTGRLSVWPPLPPGAHLRPAAEPSPFPLGDSRCRLYARARHGLFQGVRALGLEAGDEVLMPAFHHGSEVEALLRAGLTFRYYEGDDLLAPDEDELASLIGPRVRALYLIHYLGTSQDGARWRAWADERGLLLIEDAAMAWLADHGGRPVGSHGDLSVWCCYKTVGVPDGGAALARVPLPRPARGPLGVVPVARRHGAWLVSRGWLPPKAPRPRPPYDPAADFALGDLRSAASPLTRRLLPRLGSSAVAAARRANHRVLASALADLVSTAFAELPGGASPFVLPITVGDKPGTVDLLAARGVEVLPLWAVPHPSLPAGDFPRAASLRASVIGLPVHQELRPEDLERIVRAVRAAVRS